MILTLLVKYGLFYGLDSVSSLFQQDFVAIQNCLMVLSNLLEKNGFLTIVVNPAFL
jgi:hypothetical protein